MSKIPFERFIITLLFFNKSLIDIIEKLKTFGYHITEPEVKEVFDYIRETVSTPIVELLNSGQILDAQDEQHSQWMKHFGVYEFYVFTLLGNRKVDNPPEYFKWFSDCLWIHTYEDIMCLVNILLFNDEPLESISDIVQFKYKKKVGIDALQLYRKIFWNTEFVTAKEALYHCVPFRNNAMIIRKMRSGMAEVEMLGNLTARATTVGFADEANDGSDIPFTFHNSDYIKWKIGYKNISIPSTKDFLEQVKRDSYYRYYEAMSMTQSAETITEDGRNDAVGAFGTTTIRKRNVEEARVAMAKKWLDIFLKAEESMPADNRKAFDFFERMDQLELEFENSNSSEKIVRIEDAPNILQDIKQDMST